MNYALNPFIVIWEVTQACDLACVHCRAEAQALRNAGELNTDEGLGLIDQISAMDNPLLVLTGGDPLKRPDLDTLVAHAVRRGLRISVTPSGTALLDSQAVHRFKTLGIARLALSLDGPDKLIHDRFRGVKGSFDWTLEACRAGRSEGLELQINTTISRHNLHLVEDMAPVIARLGAVLWSVFFLVPVGRAGIDQALTAGEFETVFAQLHRIAGKRLFDVKTTEAPHFRRYVAQHMPLGPAPSGSLARMRTGIGDGRGFVFVSHLGEVYPSGFLPLSGGNVRRRGLAEIYRTSKLFTDLRNPDMFHGKCGNCEFRHACGGSRARAYAATGDYLGSDPACSYNPKVAISI